MALEKIKLEYEIKNLTLLARSNRLDHYNNRQQMLNVEYRIAHLKDRLPQLKQASQVFKSHERRDDEGKLISLQVRFNGIEFTKLKDANEYMRTVTLDSTTQLTVNGLDIPLAVSDALIKDELGNITDITAVRYSLAGEWFDVPRPEAHMGLPSAQSLLTSVLRRGGDLPAKILETEATIQGNEATLASLHTALGYESPYEAKLKEYEQRLAEIDKELLGKTEEVEELVDAETEERMRPAKHTVDLASPENLRVSKIVSCGPCGGREMGDLLNGPVGQSRQDLIQVFADGDAEPPAAFNHGEDRSYTRSSFFAADMDPVFAAQSDSPDILPMSVMN